MGNETSYISSSESSPFGDGGSGLAKRIIPCREIKDGRTVTGSNVEN
jgi:hypothetical protein